MFDEILKLCQRSFPDFTTIYLTEIVFIGGCRPKVINKGIWDITVYRCKIRQIYTKHKPINRVKFIYEVKI